MQRWVPARFFMATNLYPQAMPGREPDISSCYGEADKGDLCHIPARQMPQMYAGYCSRRATTVEKLA
jgi:hypothetical protein